MHRTLSLVVLAALVLAPGVAPAATPRLPLADLARAVAQADAVARQDFALVALDEMTLAYRAEAERVHEQRQRRAVEAGKTARWSSGTSAYAAELESMTGRAREAASIEIHVDATDALLLVIDGAPVAVAGPRIGEPGLLEGAIVARFCRLHDCAWLLPPQDPGAEPAAPPPPPPLVEWAFSDRGGAVCRTGDGFEFRFRDLADLERRRAACAMVVDEFRRIARRLEALRATGVVVDLQWLAIAAAPAGDGHLLTLNARGEHTRLALPALASIHGLLRFGLLWLDAQRRGAPGSLLLSNAGATLSPAVELAASGGVVR